MIHAKSVELAPPAPAAAAEAFAPAGKPPSQRFHHLDALRAALMFWGVLVHAGTVVPNAVFRTIAEVSGLVRMEAFFVISGFLGYMLLGKYGGLATVRRRVVAIGVPLVVTLLLLNPVTNYLVLVFHNGPVSPGDFLAGKWPADAKGPMVWHLHLWFLVALLVYSLLAPVMKRAVDGGLRLASSRRSAFPPELRFLAMAAAVVVACIAARVVFEAAKGIVPENSRYVVRSVGNFLPFYFVGMALFASTRLREAFSTVHWGQTLLSCGLLYGAHHWGELLPDRAAGVWLLAAQTYVAVCLSSLLFWLAGKCVSAGHPRIRSLSESAYSVYLFHYLTIYLIAFPLRAWVSSPLLLLVLVSVATFATTLCLHRFVIRRLPVLEFLFNGKPLKRPR